MGSTTRIHQLVVAAFLSCVTITVLAPATVQASHTNHAVDVNVGTEHVCTLLSSGGVVCSGLGEIGQLGNGQTKNKNFPVAVTGGALTGKTITQLDVGAYLSCAVFSDSSSACWGANDTGELGIGESGFRNIPTAVDTSALGGKTIKRFDPAQYTNCGLLSDDTLACWGYGGYGTHGTGVSDNWDAPVASAGGALEGKTITNFSNSGAHVCAVSSDGTLACWGLNWAGQIGIGNTQDQNLPVAVTGGALAGKTVTQVSAGYGFTCALTSDDTVACWGENGDGQLGIDNTDDQSLPVAVTGGALTGKTVTKIVVGGSHACALVSDGTLACWGNNGDGQLGIGNTDDQSLPVAVTGGALTGVTVQQMEVGWNNTCAVLDDGQVSCWGWNFYGQFGNGDRTQRFTPTLIGFYGPDYVTPDPAVNTALPYASGTYVVGQTLLANAGTWTGTPEPLIEYEWYGCTAIVSNPTQTIPDTCSSLSSYQEYIDLTSAHVGKYIAVHVTATVAGAASVSWLAASNDDPVINPVRAVNTVRPYISGTALVGQYLRAYPGTWTGTPTPSITYQWYTCTAKITSARQTVPDHCSTISATEELIELTSAHAGKYIAVKVTGTTTGTDPVWWLAISTPTKVMMRAANTVRPTVTGQARVGKTLTANKGTWTGSPSPTFTYKWYACSAVVETAKSTIPRSCQLITGATKATFKLTTAQASKFIAVQVTGTSQGTSGVSWLSQTSAKVS